MPNISQANLTKAGEALWQRYDQHLDFSEGFVLVFIFHNSADAVKIFHQRTCDFYRAREKKLLTYQVNAPEDLTHKVMIALFGYIPKIDMNTPHWLDISQHSEENWQQARFNFLARLNEQREKLRSALNAVLVLVSPMQERNTIKALVPDLWAVRSFALDLEDGLIEETSALGAHEQLLLAEWQCVQGKVQRGVLLAGWNVVDALLDKGQLTQAQMIAEDVVTLARTLAQSGTPQSLSDLSASLDRLRNTQSGDALCSSLPPLLMRRSG